MNTLKSYCILLLLPACLSCVKHAGDVYPDTPVARIDLLSPAGNSVISLSDSVHIQARCISTQTIHGCDLTITRVGDTTRFFSTHIHDHNDTLLIDKMWKPGFTTATDLELTLRFALDHEGNTATKQLRFRVQ